MREVIIALLSSSITIVIASFFNYHFLVRKESRMQATSYKVEILEKLYMPLMKEVTKSELPFNGYMGLSEEGFNVIDRIIIDNYQLVSPDLALIHKILIEERHMNSNGYSGFLVDEDKYLLNHLEYNFNFYRKELGLPYNKEEMIKALNETKIVNGKVKKRVQPDEI